MILTVTANPAVDVAYFVDSFNMGNVHRPARTVVTAGGKGLNVSRVAVTLGARVTAMGFIGGGNGAFIKSEAESLGIRCAFTEIAGETRCNTDIIDAHGNVGEILEPGPEITKDEERAFLESYSRELDSHGVVCISGSLPRGLTAEFYCKLIRLAKERGKRVIADTGGSALERVVTAQPYMIKPNSDELTDLFGSLDVRSALERMQEMGVEMPFATLGGDGAMLLDGGRCYRFRLPRLNVKNTVGSGDSTVGGIAVGLCRGMPICDAVRLGMASGMANTQFEATGTVSCQLVEKFYKEIITEVL